MNAKVDLKFRFERACEVLFTNLSADEAAALGFSGEDSTFLRFNAGRVRQIGSVINAQADFKYYRDGRTLAFAVNLTGLEAEDTAAIKTALGHAREEAALLPEDPYQTLPTSSETSQEDFSGRFPDPSRLTQDILAPADSLAEVEAEFVGTHAQGTICRGAAASSGARHWFATQTFATDWSAYVPNGKAVKSCYAGRDWDRSEWKRSLDAEKERLTALSRPERVLSPGKYRAYLTPEALAKFIEFFSWDGLSERALQEGESAWSALWEGRRPLSPKFGLTQDFSLGVEPRFNGLGEAAPETLPIIQEGRLANTLVSARSAKRYGAISNAAPDDESLRSAAIGPGDLDESRILSVLGTGLYIPNLHYLNWSDHDSARVTGMTRFACVWVENGKITSPIKDMRFDESLYRLFGDKLEGLTRRRSLVADTSSYSQRSLGGALLPGILIDGFTFTL